jgi:hypothetical protein
LIPDIKKKTKEKHCPPGHYNWETRKERIGDKPGDERLRGPPLWATSRLRFWISSPGFIYDLDPFGVENFKPTCSERGKHCSEDVKECASKPKGVSESNGGG